MKNKLKENFPESYRHRLLDELHRPRQGSMSVQTYTTAFDDLTLRCELQNDPHQTKSRFCFGLRTDIQWAMISHSQTIQTLAQASQLAKDIEASFRSSLDHIFILKAGEQYSVPNDIVDDSKVVEDVYVSPEATSVIDSIVVESCTSILDEVHEFSEGTSDDVDV